MWMQCRSKGIPILGPQALVTGLGKCCFLHMKPKASNPKLDARTKKRPHCWGHSLKEAMEGKLGKAMQGADPAAGSA